MKVILLGATGECLLDQAWSGCLAVIRLACDDRLGDSARWSAAVGAPPPAGPLGFRAWFRTATAVPAIAV